MNKQPNVSFKLLAFAVLLCFAAGCAGASTPTPSPASVIGTWTATATQEDGPLFQGRSGEVTFANNGRMLYLEYTGMGIANDLFAYTVTQDRLVLMDERSECIKYGFPTANYKWSVENDALTLTAIDDVCYTRREMMERTWAKKTTGGTPFPTMRPMLK